MYSVHFAVCSTQDVNIESASSYNWKSFCRLDCDLYIVMYVLDFRTLFCLNAWNNFIIQFIGTIWYFDNFHCQQKFRSCDFTYIVWNDFEWKHVPAFCRCYNCRIEFFGIKFKTPLHTCDLIIFYIRISTLFYIFHAQFFRFTIVK